MSGVSATLEPETSPFAAIEDAMADAETQASLDGKPTVLVTIRRQSGTNTVQVVDAVGRGRADDGPPALLQGLLQQFGQGLVQAGALQVIEPDLAGGLRPVHLAHRGSLAASPSIAPATASAWVSMAR